MSVTTSLQLTELDLNACTHVVLLQKELATAYLCVPEAGSQQKQDRPHGGVHDGQRLVVFVHHRHGILIGGAQHFLSQPRFFVQREPELPRLVVFFLRSPSVFARTTHAASIRIIKKIKLVKQI